LRFAAVILVIVGLAWWFWQSRGGIQAGPWALAASRAPPCLRGL